MSNSDLNLPEFTTHQILGRGGMATVYLATQHSLQRQVAIKVMSASLDHDFATRFVREAQLVATLNHPHIVTIYDVGQLPDGRQYLCMEYLSGEDLKRRIGWGLHADEVRRILRQIAQALAAVHEKGLIHRDLKPANILFRDNGDAVLTDFGIAKPLDADVELTQTGVVLGSPAYSSPEQVTAQVMDARSDIYSLGVVLVEMLLGSNPYRAGDYASTVMNQMQLPTPALPEQHAAWRPIVARMLAKSREARFGSVAELLLVLDGMGQAAADDPTMARTTVTSPSQSAVRHSWRRYGLVFGLLLALAAGGGGFWYHKTAPQRQVQRYLSLAEDRLASDQLSRPDADNAVYYFRQALTLDTQNAQAQSGLQRIALRYATLAEEALAKHQAAAARDLIARGLELEPDDPALRSLQARAEATRSRPQRLLDKLFGG